MSGSQSKAFDAARLLFAGFLILGVAVRILVLRHDVSLEGDCAVLGLIAKHISEGKEFSVYLWLAHYSGTLSAYITAIWFKLFGISAESYEITSFLFSALFVWLCVKLCQELFPEADPLFAFILAAIPSRWVVYLSLRYQYNDSMVLGCVVLWLLARYRAESEKPVVLCVGMGLASGIGLWTSPQFLPFLLAQPFVFWRSRDQILKQRLYAYWIGSFLVGYFPAILYNIQHPGAQMYRMAGRFFDLGRADFAASSNPVGLVLRRALWRISTIPLSLARIPLLSEEMTSWLDLGVFVAAWAWLWTSDRKKSLSRAYSLLSIFTLSYVFVYAFFIGEDKIRMMFPFYLPFVLVAGKFLSDLSKTRASAVWLLTAAIVAWHGYDVAAYLRRPKAHYRELAEYLESHHLTRGFADYWVAYPVIFHSHENVLISPTLIYPSFSERRPEYTRIVRASEDPVVILDRRINAGEIKPLEDRLQALGVRYRKTAFDEFLIYSDLTPKAFPERIALLGYRDP